MKGLEQNSVIRDAHRDYLHNVLNEVLHGFNVDLGMQLHSQYDQVLALLNALDEADAQYQLSPKDALLLIRASDLCEAEFEDSEFGTRLGSSKQKAREIVSQLEPIAGDDLRPNMKPGLQVNAQH